MSDKEFVLSIYPNAYCRIINAKNTRYEICVNNKTIAVSFIDEITVWKWGKTVVNDRIINKLSI